MTADAFGEFIVDVNDRLLAAQVRACEDILRCAAASEAQASTAAASTSVHGLPTTAGGAMHAATHAAAPTAPRIIARIVSGRAASAGPGRARTHLIIDKVFECLVTQVQYLKILP